MSPQADFPRRRAPFLNLRQLSLSIGASIALAAPGSAQVWEVDPLAQASVGPDAGFVVAAIGDLDGDGLRDGLISSITDGAGRGRVYGVSSSTGDTVLSVGGLLAGDWFGHSVDGVSDVDGDGVADLIVGAPAVNQQRPGEASMHSGATGARLWTATGENQRDSFGWVVAGVGDVNGDGIDDVASCAPGHDPGGVANAGKVYVLSGADGSLIRAFEGATASGSFGASCGRAGDVDGDGVADLVVCSLRGGANGKGEATVFSGSDGSSLWNVSAGAAARQYGNYFSGEAGDVNADGTPDVYVIDYVNIQQRGRLFVYSGVDGTLLHSIRDPESGMWTFGRVRIGDLDGDGHDDLLLCSGRNSLGGSNAGAVYFYSGATGKSLGRLTAGTAGLRMGTDCVSVGDVDGDGREDVFVGVGMDAAGVGGAFVLPTQPAPPVAYCDGAVNSTGASAELDYAGTLELNGAAPQLGLTVIGLPDQALSIAFGGPAARIAPAGDGTRCVGHPAVRLDTLTPGSTGFGAFVLPVPTAGSAAAVIGSPWHIQVWYRDALGAGSGFNLSSALRLTFR